MSTGKLYLGFAGFISTAVAVFFLVNSATSTAASVTASGDPAHAGCTGHADEKAGAGMESYVFAGTVKSVDREKSRVTLQHEKIGDYMEAMTMPFTVHDVKLLDGLEPGVRRWFVLHVMESRSMIVAVADSKEKAEAAMGGAHGAMHGEARGASHGEHEGGAGCCASHGGAEGGAEKSGGHAGCGGH